jgi:hypothetical protein
VAALLLSLGAPLVPSKEEQARLSKLWKKPIPSPIDILDRRFGSAHASRAVTQAKERQPQRTPRSPLNLALLCLIVLTRDRYVVAVAQHSTQHSPTHLSPHYAIHQRRFHKSGGHAAHAGDAGAVRHCLLLALITAVRPWPLASGAVWVCPGAEKSSEKEKNE